MYVNFYVVDHENTNMKGTGGSKDDYCRKRKLKPDIGMETKNEEICSIKVRLQGQE